MPSIIVINNYVDFPPEEKTSQHLTSDTIMFLGKMDYDPNIIAVSYFVKNIFPKLKPKYNNLRFLVVGAKPTKEILDFAQIDGIEVTGFVENTEPYFQNSTIVIAPMLSGAGVQNKIIQAMSYGCCVATTSLGAEGIMLKGGELAIFDGDEEWINGISYLLNNRNLRIKMGKNARETIIQTLSKEIIYQQFCRLFAD